MVDEQQPVRKPGRPAKTNANKTLVEKERQKSILQNSKSKHPFIYSLYQEKQNYQFKNPLYIEKT